MPATRMVRQYCCLVVSHVILLIMCLNAKTPLAREGCTLVDIAAQHSLEGLGHEAALDHQAGLAIQIAAGSQLCQQEGLHVLQLPVHRLAELQEVCEDCLLCAFTSHLEATAAA